MSTAFQKNAFQNNAFQIVISIADTHDGLPKKFYLPIYEAPQKKKIHEKIKRVSKKLNIPVQIEDVDDKQHEKLIAGTNPVYLKKWDDATIEAHAEATSQSIEKVQEKLAILQKYEDELNEEEEDFFSLVLLALS